MSSTEFFESLFSLSALQRAWFRVEESDGCAGIDNVSLPRFASNFDREIKRLRTDILTETYQPLPLLRFYIPKKKGGKRALNVAAVRDRIAQRAVIANLEPLLEAEFEDCSYAYRRGRSVRQALDQIEFLRDSGYTWVLEADITAYFDAIDHDILLKKLVPFIADEKILQLVKLWIKAKIYDGRRLWETENGLPQGQPVAPVLANLYLDSFDEEMLKGGRKLVRFADDFVVLCKSKPKAQAALRLTQNLLKDLKLSLREDKTRVTNFTEGFKYLGATFARSFCIIQPGEKPEATEVEMPFKLYAADALTQIPRVFNASLGNELKSALVNPENDIVPLVVTEKRGEKMKTENNLDSPFSPPALFTLCTLYIHEHGAILRYENERLEVIKDETEIFSIPINKIEQIALFGNSQITTAVMKNCLRREIPILLFSGQGKFLGRIAADSTENVILQQIQFQKTSDERFVTNMAKRIAAGKIGNGKAFLQRRRRDKAGENLTKAIEQMTTLEEKLAGVLTLDEILGCEGAAGAAYFTGFGDCLAAPFKFMRRTRRPPQDAVNALLSFGYSMLFQNIYGLVKARGLSPHVGNLHTLRQGHPALCSDLIEEFRSPIVDSLVVSAINKKVLLPEDFFFEDYIREEVEEIEVVSETEPKHRCLLTDQARRKFIRQFEQRMNMRIHHQGANLRTNWRGCIDLQIGHYIKVLRGEADHYLPFEYR